MTVLYDVCSVITFSVRGFESAVYKLQGKLGVQIKNALGNS